MMATNKRLLCERCGPNGLAEVYLADNPIGDKKLCRKCAYSEAPCNCQGLPMDTEKAAQVSDIKFRPVLEFGKVVAWHCDFCKERVQLG